MRSEDPLSEYFFRIVMILLYISPILICIQVTQHYKTRTAQKLVDSFADTMKTGAITLSDYQSHAEALGRIGYSLEFYVYSYDAQTGFEDFMDMEAINAEIIAHNTTVNGMPAYRLRPRDFVHVIAKGQHAVVQSSATYYGEKRVM